MVEDVINWQTAFNDIQIEVEYLRSQNNALMNKLHDMGLEWEDGMEVMESGIVVQDMAQNSSLQLELDNAIRTIHEREMRCQELTWEITKVIH